MEIVSELLGHSSRKITQEYYSKLVQKRVIDEMERLISIRSVTGQSLVQRLLLLADGFFLICFISTELQILPIWTFRVGFLNSRFVVICYQILLVFIKQKNTS